MSKLRSINTAFWSDTWIECLEPNHKLLFLYLVTNDKTNMLGIYESSKRKISFETGLSLDTVDNGLKAFETVNKVKYINNYIVLVNYMKHQKYNTNMKKSAIDIYNSLPKELKGKDLIVSKDNPLKGFESLLNHYGMVSKVEVEVEVEVENEDEQQHKRKLGDVEYDLKTVSGHLKYYTELTKDLISHETWIESLYRNDKIQKGKLGAIVDKFIIHLQSLEIKERPKTLADFKSHCANWIRVKIRIGEFQEYRTIKQKGSI